jgi:hypothetical protein
MGYTRTETWVTQGDALDYLYTHVTTIRVCRFSQPSWHQLPPALSTVWNQPEDWLQIACALFDGKVFLGTGQKGGSRLAASTLNPTILRLLNLCPCVTYVPEHLLPLSPAQTPPGALRARRGSFGDRSGKALTLTDQDRL